MSEKNVKLSIYGNFARAFSVDANPANIKKETIEVELSEQAAKMIFADLEKVMKGKQ